MLFFCNCVSVSGCVLSMFGMGKYSWILWSCCDEYVFVYGVFACMWSSGKQSCHCVYFVVGSKGLTEAHRPWFLHLISFCCCELISATLNPLWFRTIKIRSFLCLLRGDQAARRNINNLNEHSIIYSPCIQYASHNESPAVVLCNFVETSRWPQIAPHAPKAARMRVSSASNSLARNKALSSINSTGHL